MKKWSPRTTIAYGRWHKIVTFNKLENKLVVTFKFAPSFMALEYILALIITCEIPYKKLLQFAIF